MSTGTLIVICIVAPALSAVVAYLLGCRFGQSSDDGRTQGLQDALAKERAEDSHEDIDRVRDMRPIDDVRARAAIDSYRELANRIDGRDK